MKHFNFSIFTAAATLGAAAILATSAAHAAIPSFADIPADHWFGAAPGTGVNESGLEILWDDGKAPDPVLYGFRWIAKPEQTNPITNETSTPITSTHEMLDAITAADPHLYIKYLNFPGFGDLINGAGYFATPATPPELNIVPATPGNEDAHAVNPADHYTELFNTGFWSYNIASAGDADFDFSPVGIGDRGLSDGSWDQFEPIVFPTPEPASLGLLGMGGMALITRRGKRAKAAVASDAAA